MCCAEQWSGNRIDDWRQAHADRRLDIRNRAGGRMRDFAEAIPVAHFRVR